MKFLSSPVPRAPLRILSGALLLVTIGFLLTRLRSSHPDLASEHGPTGWCWSCAWETTQSAIAPPATTATTTEINTKTTLASEQQLPLPAPAEYANQTEQTDFCRDRYTLKYLADLRDHPTQYCEPDARSRLTCFHTRAATDGHGIDSLCVGSGVVYDSATGKFTLDCPQRTLSAEDISGGETPLEKVRSYWYDTGPRHILDRYVSLSETGGGGGGPLAQQVRTRGGGGGGGGTTTDGDGGNPPKFVLLLKREGEGNTWHTLLEIMSASWTVDVLRMARDPASGEPVLQAPEDVADTQVVILDERGDGPYFDLWRMFSGREPKRLVELDPSARMLLTSSAASSSSSSVSSSTQLSSSSWLAGPIDNIIIPLAGASNPLWHKDWASGKCAENALVHTFAARVLARYNISDEDNNRREKTANEVRVTFLDRRGTRRLVGQEDLLDAVRARLPHARIQAVDFAALKLADQLRVARDTDVLVGVHGAGLTNMMFMRQGGVGAVVEIQPAEVRYQVFRNLAVMLGHEYFVAHGTTIDPASEPPPQLSPWSPRPPPGAPAPRRRAADGEAAAVAARAASTAAVTATGHEEEDDQPAESGNNGTTSGTLRKRDWHGLDVGIEQDRFVALVEMAVKSLYNKDGRFDDAV